MIRNRIITLNPNDDQLTGVCSRKALLQIRSSWPATR